MGCGRSPRYGLVPEVFVDYGGVIPAGGRTRASVRVPDLPALVGYEIHSDFVTLSASAPSGVRTVSNTASFRITP